MKEEPRKYFTPREVEALIPELTRVMRGLMDAHREAQRVRSVLQEEERRVMLSGGAVLDRATWGEKSRRLEELMRQIQDGIAAIMRMGGVPKDLGLGLVDFPHLLNREEVNLCWRFGETRIGFWHGLDEGYAGRKPL